MFLVFITIGFKLTKLRDSKIAPKTEMIIPRLIPSELEV